LSQRKSLFKSLVRVRVKWILHLGHVNCSVAMSRFSLALGDPQCGRTCAPLRRRRRDLQGARPGSGSGTTAPRSEQRLLPVLISLVMRYSLAIAVKREVALERMVRRSLGGNGRSRV